ncbi:hypothetical protein ACLIJJ_26110 [Niallia sp. BSM11]
MLLHDIYELQPISQFEQERTGRTSAIIRMSNGIGVIAQLNDRISVTLRDTLFPHVPSRIWKNS